MFYVPLEHWNRARIPLPPLDPSRTSHGGAGCQHTLGSLHFILLTAIVTWLSIALWSSIKKEGGEKKSGKSRMKSITLYNHLMRCLRGKKNLRKERKVNVCWIVSVCQSFCWPKQQITGPLISTRAYLWTWNRISNLQSWSERKGNDSTTSIYQ